jgi:Ca-activated chloride channel family protein
MTTTFRFAIASLLATLLVPRVALAQDSPPDTTKTLSPYFWVESSDPSVDRLPLKDTRVDVSISGVIADVTVRQVYENSGQRPLHARYVFPASTRAAVYGMTMTVGDVRIVARIKEREQAKQEFVAAKREGKSASLLEQNRPNVFTMNVANVLPGDTISVELKYTELLVPTDGVYEFTYPTVVGPRYSSAKEAEAPDEDAFVRTPYTHAGVAPKSEFHLTGRLSTGVPIQELVSPSHQIAARPTMQGRAEFAIADVDQASNNRDFILRYRLAGRQISSGLLLYQGDDENFFLLMAQPPRTVAPADVPAREYIFVLDVSGSMNGFPLDTAKTLMRDLIKGMRPTDSFNIVVFESGSQMLSPTPIPATSGNLEQALAFIGPKAGSGGTELLSALKRALAIPHQQGVSRTVVLVTDGFISAERSVFDYVREHLDDTNVFAFGIGSSVNRYLIEGVAQAGQGEPFVVTGPEAAPEAAASFRHYIDSPVLTGIEVSFVGFDAFDVEPKKIPDLFASRPIVVFGKWRGAVGGSIEIAGTTGREPYRASIDLTQATPDEDHRALRHLWARTRIRQLSDFGMGDPAAEQIAEITQLGLTYGLLTRYTSFIAVHEVIRRAAGDADNVDQPSPMPQGVSDLAVGVTAGDEPELAWVVAALLAAFACFSLSRKRESQQGAR